MTVDLQLVALIWAVLKKSSYAFDYFSMTIFWVKFLNYSMKYLLPICETRGIVKIGFFSEPHQSPLEWMVLKLVAVQRNWPLVPIYLNTAQPACTLQIGKKWSGRPKLAGGFELSEVNGLLQIPGPGARIQEGYNIGNWISSAQGTLLSLRSWKKTRGKHGQKITFHAA